jgi:hypothetical protein
MGTGGGGGATGFAGGIAKLGSGGTSDANEGRTEESLSSGGGCGNSVCSAMRGGGGVGWG